MRGIRAANRKFRTNVFLSLMDNTLVWIISDLICY